MRSIRYILTCVPCNFSDFLDYAKNYNKLYLLRPHLRLRLITREDHLDAYSFRCLIGIFVWEFDKKTFVHEIEFGRIFYHENELRQKLSVDKANERLITAITNINSLGCITFSFEEPKKFSYDGNILPD